jgi:hypothetical protein
VQADGLLVFVLPPLMLPLMLMRMLAAAACSSKRGGQPCTGHLLFSSTRSAFWRSECTAAQVCNVTAWRKKEHLGCIQDVAH